MLRHLDFFANSEVILNHRPQTSITRTAIAPPPTVALVRVLRVFAKADFAIQKSNAQNALV